MTQHIAVHFAPTTDVRSRTWLETLILIELVKSGNLAGTGRRTDIIIEDLRFPGLAFAVLSIRLRVLPFHAFVPVSAIRSLHTPSICVELKQDTFPSALVR